MYMCMISEHGYCCMLNFTLNQARFGLPNDVAVCIFLYLTNKSQASLKHLMITMAEEQINTHKHTNGAD